MIKYASKWLEKMSYVILDIRIKLVHSTMHAVIGDQESLDILRLIRDRCRAR